LGHSNREFTAVAPAGFAEPKVWIAEDYVVITWRQLGSGGTHDDGPREVKLYVYQWVSQWKEQFLQTINAVSLQGSAPAFKDYNNFQVATQKDFFGVLAGSTSNVHTLFARFKDPSNRGVWSYYTSTYDYGTGKPTLMSGTNFLAVGSFQDDGTHPSHLYTFQGSTFQDITLNQPIGDHYYTSTNNYFISHNRAGVDTYPEINFHYLSEDKKWVAKSWGSILEFSSNDPSFWHSSNSMAIAMADDNPEYAYRWDLTYTNFFRDTKDKNNADLFGSILDTRPVFIMNNSLVGIDGRLARYDGLNWSTASISSAQNSPFGLYISYGDDYAVRPTEYVISTSNYKGGRKVFNPNTLNWESDVIMDGADRGLDFANAGIDYYYFGNGFYYRQSDGTWIKKLTYSPTGYNQWSKGGWPRYDLVHGSNISNPSNYNVLELRGFKNGEILSPLSLSSKTLLFAPNRFPSNGVGGQTIVTYSNAFSSHDNATSIILNRMIGDVVTGSQKDYPVTLITVNDGISNKYTSLDYNTSTVTIDASGTVAQYNEVTEIPGSSVSTNKPYGYTKTFFHNGLTSSELGVPFFVVDLLWSGAPYKKEVYDKNNVLKASEKTTFQTYSKTLQNDLSVLVNIGSYVRPIEVRNMADNIETVTTNTYATTTGLPTQSIITNFDSKSNNAIIDYKYFWEHYDVSRTLNILSPLIQTKKSVSNGVTQTYTEVSATTWKTWNSVYAPHKIYTWKRTGSTDFNFSSWSGTGEPATDWFKGSEINAVSTNGNLTQVTNN